MIVIKINR